jgi:hypothetical protein
LTHLSPTFPAPNFTYFHSTVVELLYTKRCGGDIRHILAIFPFVCTGCVSCYFDTHHSLAIVFRPLNNHKQALWKSWRYLVFLSPPVPISSDPLYIILLLVLSFCLFTCSYYKFIQPIRLTTPKPRVHCILGNRNFNYPADKSQPVVPNDPIPHSLNSL